MLARITATPQDHGYVLAGEIQPLLPLFPDIVDLSQHVAEECFFRRVMNAEALNGSDQLIEVFLRSRAAVAAWAISCHSTVATDFA